MKNKYFIDSSGRLNVKQRQRRLSLEGKFSIDKDNRLVYWLNKPAAWRRTYNLARKIVFEGRWQLNPNYDLEFILTETKEQYKNDCLLIKGKIISADEDALIFEMKSFDSDGLLHLQILKITGLWQANEYNQITFVVNKKTLPDILTLEGNWQINQNQQITYAYEKTELKRKTKVSHALAFTGFWQINSVNKLTYIFARGPNSQFDFRVQLETPNLYPQQGVIKYRLGIGLKELFPQGTAPLRIISLYGTWKFSRKLGVVFQMDYGKDKIQKMEFGADVYLTPKDEIAFSLMNKKSEPLGINITLIHKFLQKNDAQAFLRFKKDIQGESRVEAGVRIPF